MDGITASYMVVRNLMATGPYSKPPISGSTEVYSWDLWNTGNLMIRKGCLAGPASYKPVLPHAEILSRLGQCDPATP
jgi:hypothetical protein